MLTKIVLLFQLIGLGSAFVRTFPAAARVVVVHGSRQFVKVDASTQFRHSNLFITALRATAIDDVNTEFDKLCAGKPTVSFMKFLNMNQVQELLNSEAMTMEDVSTIWRDIAGDLNTAVDRPLFVQLNKALQNKIVGSSAMTNNDDMDLSGINVFDKDFDPSTVFDKESLNEITAFFVKSAGSMNGKLSYSVLKNWEDVKAMFDEGLMTEEALQEAWKEASKGATTVSYDGFLRLNVRLDLLMDEFEVAQEQINASGVIGTPVSSGSKDSKVDKTTEDASAESFYRSEFREICGNGRLMRLDMLLEWKEIRELIDDGVVTEKQISKMFDGMPKEPMGLPANSVGITQDTFVAFNGMLDVLLDAGAGTSSSNNPPIQQKTAPSSLVNEPARPMPSMTELKMGSLSEDTNIGDDDATTGLSENELELMETLDKADNMLNSGSFGDFDRLIGDVNDPRLQALREKRDGADEVRGQLQDILQELLMLGKKQTRCGLDKPDEETSARIRDLVQAVVEKAPKIATQNIDKLRTTVNGKWQLMFTNSEMFDFYNGVTGFANVFPAAKFDSLKVSYASDGYLAEAQYLEKLNTPLGAIDATVYANWDLLKEMSFMTNENSVVLRSYCTKVTAGPMEYEAQENWKSLRTMSMNELVYLDDKIMIKRNCGALRIFFVYERLNG